MLLGADSRLDNLGMEGVGNQRNGQVDLAHGLIKSLVIVDIEGDGLGVLESFAKLLRALEGSACWFSE
jgi:hypothetical protein